LTVIDVVLLVVTANGLAVPLRETDCGEPTLFEIVNCAVRRPAAAGVKVTPMGQLLPGAMGAVHPLLNEKSAKFAPESATLETLSVAVPVPTFSTIKFCAVDAVPARIVENVNVPADRAIEAVPFEPVPQRYNLRAAARVVRDRERGLAQSDSRGREGQADRAEGVARE
jgi:hypothetical protein